MATLKSPAAQTSAGCRVLIVEDDPEWRDIHADNLAAWGYGCIVANGTGQALLQDAIHKAYRYRCHIALVDMRLIEHSHRDTSGLKIIPRLKPTEAIVVSGYGDPETTVKALKHQGAFDFVAKSENPARLREVLSQARCLFCRQDFDIWYTGYEPRQILQKLRLEGDGLPEDEPRDALGRLFGQHAVQGQVTIGLDLRPVTAYYRTTDEATPLERSIVFVARPKGADGNWQQEEIVKLALSSQIRAELNSYHQYVKPYLQPDRTARIEDSTNAVILWDIGAIRYTNIATRDRLPLRQWYVKASAPQISNALTDLFDITLSPWYAIQSPSTRSTMYDYYIQLFAKLGPRLESFSDVDETLELPNFPRRLRNPVTWVQQHALQSRFITRWEAYTHGDLHSDNVFVDQRTSTTCIIDFERSGPGHILRDFVELETDIQLRLATFAWDDLETVHQFNVQLYTPDHPHQQLHWQPVAGASERAQAEAQKALDVISTLRYWARALTRFERMEEYYWALLMETLISLVRNYADWDDQAAARLAYARALISASLLADRLAHWGRAWLSQTAPPAIATPTKTSPLVRYNVAAIRKLLDAGLSDNELTGLCHDHYYLVYQQFTTGMDREQRTTLLLNHCFRHLLLEELIQDLKQLNSRQYANFESQLWLENPPTPR